MARGGDILFWIWVNLSKLAELAKSMIRLERG